MKSIKFANGKKYEIIECYNNGKRYIQGETRENREIVISDEIINIGELKALLLDKSNLTTIEVYMNIEQEVDGEIKHFEDVEILEGFVYADEIRDTLKGEIWFTIGKKTEAENVIDTLLIAMEV